VLDSAREEAGAEYLASLVDLGRPPVIGLVEPDRELAAIARLRDELAATHPAAPSVAR
jgi:hypothetical protein